MSLHLPRWESLSRDEQVPITNPPLHRDNAFRAVVISWLKRFAERAELQAYFNKAYEFAFERPGIKVCTFNTAKGLVSDTVFVPLMGAEHGLTAPSDVERNRLHVACTRARHELCFLRSSATLYWAIETPVAHPATVDWYTLRAPQAGSGNDDLPF